MPSVDLNHLITQPRYAVLVENAAKTDNHLRVAKFYLLAAASAGVAIAAFVVFIWSSDQQARDWGKNTLTVIVASGLGFGVGSQKAQQGGD